MRGRFLEAILKRTERELAGPGRPGTVDRLVAKVERREVPRPTSLGARGALPREVGTLILPLRVPAGALAPPAAPPPRAVREGLAKPRTLCAARTRKCGCCLKCESGKLRCPNTLCVIRGLDPRIHRASQESFEEDGLSGQALQ